MRRLALPALLVAALLAGCGSGSDYGGGNSTATGSTSQPTGGGGKVSVAKTGVGSVLVDGNGLTLYVFERDQTEKSACSGACAKNWPPALTDSPPAADAGVAKSKLSLFTRSDGGRQVAYDGHPLYRYSGDAKAGDTNGQGQDAFGGKWYAVSPAGATVTAAPDSGGSGGSGGSGSSSGGSGGSYGGGGY